MRQQQHARLKRGERREVVQKLFHHPLGIRRIVHRITVCIHRRRSPLNMPYRPNCQYSAVNRAGSSRSMGWIWIPAWYVRYDRPSIWYAVLLAGSVAACMTAPMTIRPLFKCQPVCSSACLPACLPVYLIARPLVCPIASGSMLWRGMPAWYLCYDRHSPRYAVLLAGPFASKLFLLACLFACVPA